MGIFDYFKKQKTSGQESLNLIKNSYSLAEQANLYNDKAYEFYDIDKYNEGIGSVKKALDLIPNYPPYLDTLTNGYLMSCEYKLAMASSTLCIEIDLENDSETSEHYLTRAKIHLKLENRNEAIEDLKKVIGFCRDDDEAIELLMSISPLSDEELEKVKKEVTFERAEKYLIKAKSYIKTGNRDEAIEHLQNIIDDIDPENIEARALLISVTQLCIEEFSKIKKAVESKAFIKSQIEFYLQQVSFWIENFSDINLQSITLAELKFLKIQLSLVLKLDMEGIIQAVLELHLNHPDFEPKKEEVLGTLLLKGVKEQIEEGTTISETNIEDNSLKTINTVVEEDRYQTKKFDFYDDNMVSETERQEFLIESEKVDIQELFDLDGSLQTEADPHKAINVLTSMINRIPLIKGVSPVSYALEENAATIDLENLYAIRARWYFHLDQIKEAKEDFSMAITVNPNRNQSYLYHYLGICKMMLNEIDSELIRAFDMAIYFNNEIESFYKISDSYYQRATVYYQYVLNQDERAKEDLIACLKLSPDDSSAKKLLNAINNNLTT
jgi:tetratricopeptide (TPR) repeat protein